jgi:trk system potassium uptake protein TrkH
MSTGGFSTQDLSIGGFESPLYEWIIIAFMILASINFVLHYRLLTGRIRAVLIDSELRYFLLTLAGATGAVAWVLSRESEMTSIRTALFQVVSLMTGTGFTTIDFEGWPALALLILLQLMVLGGMAGSTTGGVKSLRVLIGLRSLANVFERLRHRAAVAHRVRFGGKPVPDQVLAGIWAFLFAYFVMVAVVALVVAAAGYDLVTAISAGLTSVGNVGPGLGEVGPIDNFAHFPTGVKLTLCAAMTAGRLELFTILILFHRAFWRR